jgi:hypothetical protein
MTTEEGTSRPVGQGASAGMWTGIFSGFSVALNGMVGLEYHPLGVEH